MNLWDRQQNTRAQAKKKRAKAFKFSDTQTMGVPTNTQGTVVWVGHKECMVRSNREDTKYPLSPSLETLVVGDVVYLENHQIVGVRERHTFLARIRTDSTRRSGVGDTQVVVANIDKAIIVASVTQPEFHPRFIDRYLIACQLGGVEPVICLTKTDLSGEHLPSLDEYRKLGITVIETSAHMQEGIHELCEVIAGQTVVFVGASGVGKSSLVNVILNGERAKTGEIGKKTGRGRHTTTASQLYQWMEGSYIIDTPGIRSLGLEQLDKQEIGYYFPEFGPYREQCKFSNCLHTHEPGCAVKEAVENGEITRERYKSYVRLIEE